MDKKILKKQIEENETGPSLADKTKNLIGGSIFNFFIPANVRETQIQNEADLIRNANRINTQFGAPIVSNDTEATVKAGAAYQRYITDLIDKSPFDFKMKINEETFNDTVDAVKESAGETVSKVTTNSKWLVVGLGLLVALQALNLFK